MATLMVARAAPSGHNLGCTHATSVRERQHAALLLTLSPGSQHRTPCCATSIFPGVSRLVRGGNHTAVCPCMHACTAEPCVASLRPARRQPLHAGLHADVCGCFSVARPLMHLQQTPRLLYSCPRRN